MHRVAQGVFEKYFASWNLVLAGCQVARKGGVMIGVAERDRMWEILDEDPFFVHKVAEYEVTEFSLTMWAESLECLKNNNYH